MDVRVGLWRKLSAKKLMLLNCGVGEDSWESLGLQGDPTSPYWRSVLGVRWKDWCWSWNSNTLATSCEELTHWKRLWCWEGLGAGGEGDDRGWDGWMASPTQWTCVWVNSGSLWWTGRPGVLRFMGSQRVGHDWVTELKWTQLNSTTWSGDSWTYRSRGELTVSRSQKVDCKVTYEFLTTWTLSAPKPLSCSRVNCTFDIQYHVSFRWIAYWFDIWINYEMIMKIGLIILCPHTKLLQYYWPHFLCCIPHPGGFVLLISLTNFAYSSTSLSSRNHPFVLCIYESLLFCLLIGFVF